MLAAWELPGRELAQEVVDAVDRLHGGRRVERLAERAHADVDEQPRAVGEVLGERPLRVEGDPAQDLRRDVVPRHALDAHQRRAGRHEVAERGKHLERDVGSAREIDQASASMCSSTPERGAARTPGVALGRASCSG